MNQLQMAKKRGEDARVFEKSYASNPYSEPDTHKAWQQGWREADAIVKKPMPIIPIYK